MPVAGVAIAPVRSGAGVEQHRDDGEIEFGAGARFGVGPARLARDLRPEIAPAKHEMPPARVQRHLQVRIILADDVGDEIRSRRKPVDVDAEVRQRAG